MRGHLVDQVGVGNCLEFLLEFDQTHLRHSIAQLSELVEATVGSKEENL